ncbi:MAG: hypothetical protein WCC60_12305 [Ilumatobacteraceae bacterium]
MIDSDLLSQLESELDDIYLDVTAADIRRAGRRRKVAPKLMLLASLSIAAIAVATLLPASGSHSPTVFANWTATPQPSDAAGASDPATIATLDSMCRNTDYNVDTDNPANAVLQIIDLRGNGAHTVMHDGDTWKECMSTRDSDASNIWTTGWVMVTKTKGLTPLTPSADYPAVVIGVKAPNGNAAASAAGTVDGHEATWLSGLALPEVAKITITTAIGTVEATLENGVFAAWWPGNDGDSAVVHVYDATGDEILTIDKFNCSTGTQFDWVPAYQYTQPDGLSTGCPQN